MHRPPAVLASNLGSKPARFATQLRMHSVCCSGCSNSRPSGKTRAWCCCCSQGTTNSTCARVHLRELNVVLLVFLGWKAMPHLAGLIFGKEGGPQGGVHGCASHPACIGRCRAARSCLPSTSAIQPGPHHGMPAVATTTLCLQQHSFVRQRLAHGQKVPLPAQ